MAGEQNHSQAFEFAGFQYVRAGVRGAHHVQEGSWQGTHKTTESSLAPSTFSHQLELVSSLTITGDTLRKC